MDLENIKGLRIESHDHTPGYDVDRTTLELSLDDGRTLKISAGGQGEVSISAGMDSGGDLDECVGEEIESIEVGSYSMVLNFTSRETLSVSACGREELWISVDIS